MQQRCAWAANPVSHAYHDEEWGVPVHDDRRLFEFLVLEGAQAGLSWETILRKRERYREVYDGFDPAVVAGYDDAKVAALLADPGIVRNRLKVQGSVRNARAFLEVQREFGSFARYVWGFVGGHPIVSARTTLREVPARTAESDALAKDLKRRGFTFVGSTIMYAFMQACGLAMDHTIDCPRYAELSGGT
jgi:DNA-3-methyladenine glycosylase I